MGYTYGTDCTCARTDTCLWARRVMYVKHALTGDIVFYQYLRTPYIYPIVRLYISPHYVRQNWVKRPNAPIYHWNVRSSKPHQHLQQLLARNSNRNPRFIKLWVTYGAINYLSKYSRLTRSFFQATISQYVVYHVLNNDTLSQVT